MKESFGYNYAYAVHHPAFVLMYAKYVLPAFGDSVPKVAAKYIANHMKLLNEHKEWIGNHIDQFLH